LLVHSLFFRHMPELHHLLLQPWRKLSPELSTVLSNQPSESPNPASSPPETPRELLCCVCGREMSKAWKITSKFLRENRVVFFLQLNGLILFTFAS
jgi:hypothetical protein